MKTSVTSPYCIKNCLRSSVVISSVQRPTNTFRLLNGSSKGCWFEKKKHCRLHNFQQIWKTWMRKYCEDICMDITIFTFELGNLQSHHLPSIMCRCEITFSCASYSANLTKPKPLELPVLPSRFTWILRNTKNHNIYICMYRFFQMLWYSSDKHILEPWWLLQMCWSSLLDPAPSSSREDPEQSDQTFSCPLVSFLRQMMHQFPPSSFCCLN